MMSFLHVIGCDLGSRDRRQASLSNDYIDVDKDKMNRKLFFPKKSGETRGDFVEWVKTKGQR